jgi:Amt family ammonium transporter
LKKKIVSGIMWPSKHKQQWITALCFRCLMLYIFFIRSVPAMLVRLLMVIGLVFGVTTPVLAQSNNPSEIGQLVLLLPVALMFLLPVGFLLIISSSVPEAAAPAVAVNLLVGWCLAVLAYFLVGFAFQFGGIAQVIPNPDLMALYWEWYPLDQSVDVEVARLWGVIALRGWAISGEADTPGVWLLFLSHVALVGTAAMVPVGALARRARFGAALLTSVLVGALIYPVAGNWVWGGGWLSNVGVSLNMGNGFTDFGGASLLFLAGSGVTLAGLLIFKPPEQVAVPPEADKGDQSSDLLPDAVPMPSAYLPILCALGGVLVLAGWLGVSAGLHNPTGVATVAARTAVSGLLAAMTATITAAVYSWFTTTVFNPLMAVRGLVAGLIVAAAGAPFLPLWVIVAAGGFTGLLMPLLIYFFEQHSPVKDETATLAAVGMSAFAGLILAGFGDNDLAQLQAQLLGAAAIFLWSFVVSGIGLQIYRVVAQSVARTEGNPESADANYAPPPVYPPSKTK